MAVDASSWHMRPNCTNGYTPTNFGIFKCESARVDARVMWSQRILPSISSLLTAYCCVLISLGCSQTARVVPIDKVAPHASGVWLAEVVEIVPYDSRPMDGNKGVTVKLRGVRGSGEFRQTINVVTEFGGLRLPGSDPKLPTLIGPNTLRKGKQYWFAFASIHELAKHPEGVIAFWPKGNQNVELALEDAIRNDLYCWSPQFDPKTQLSYGRRTVEGKNKQWQIRVERQGDVLWEKTVPGTMSKRYFSWTLDEYADRNFPGKVPPCGKVLVAETATRLGPENEYELPAGMVYIQTGYDPETGARLIDRVSVYQDSSVVLLVREYDADTGDVVRESKE